MNMKVKQSMSEAAMILPRAFWVLAVVGVALVAGEELPPSSRAAGMAATAGMVEARIMEPQ